MKHYYGENIIKSKNFYVINFYVIKMELTHPEPGRMNEPIISLDKSGKEVWAAEIKSEKPVNQQNCGMR